MTDLMLDTVIATMRLTNGLIFFGIGLWFAPAALRTLMCRPNHYDPIWASFCFFALNRVAFALTTYVVPESWATVICYAGAAGGAVIVVLLRRAYTHGSS